MKKMKHLTSVYNLLKYFDENVVENDLTRL